MSDPNCKPKAPDGGYGWVILTSGFLALSIHGTVIFSMTLMYQALLVKFNENASETGSLGAMLGTVILASSPIVSLLSKVLSLRVLVVSSGFLYFCGLSLAAFAVHPIMVTIGYGLLAGLAGNLMAFSFFLILPDYFDKKRSLAFGVFQSGLSFGGLVMPPVFSIWLSTYGFTGTVMLQAAITLNLVPLGMLVLPVEKTIYAKTSSKVESKKTHTNNKIRSGETEACINVDDCGLELTAENSDNTDTPSRTIISKMITFSKAMGFHHLKSGLYITYVMLVCSLMNTFFCTGIYMSGFAKERCALTNAEVAMIITIAAAVDIIFKLIIGYVLDIKFVKRRRPVFYIFIQFSNGIVGLFIGSVVDNFVGLCLTWVIHVSTINACFSQMTVILVDILGSKNFTEALGLARLFQGAWVYTSIRIAGLLIDWFVSYTYVFYYCSAVNMLSCVLFLLAYCLSTSRVSQDGQDTL